MGKNPRKKFTGFICKMTEYILVPKEVEIDKVKEKDFVLAPSSLTKFEMKNKNVKPLKSLIVEKHVGKEVGSFAYISKSNKFFIKTKAFNKNVWIPYEKGEEAIIPINPLFFRPYSLEKGDILIAKDSNIGECVYLNDDKYKEDYSISGGIVRLKIPKDTLYVFSFIKSKFFKEQLSSLVPRGSTIRHSGELYLDCLIPFPNRNNAVQIKNKISNMAQEIINNENEIIEKYKKVIKIIEKELKSNQKKGDFNYIYPDLERIQKTYRLNASVYSKSYDEQVFLVKNYIHGFSNLEDLGFKSKRGSSLEIKGLGTRIDSDKSKKGFYAIVTPSDITEYGTVEDFFYIGTKKELVKIEQGDILFGGEATRRLFVQCDKWDNVVTNYHGIKIYNEKHNIRESIFIWAFLSYWKDKGILDAIAVGGQGGHLAPEYFSYLIFPNFPDSIKKEIEELYYNKQDKDKGIYQLDKRNKELKTEINEYIHKIVYDEV